MGRLLLAAATGDAAAATLASGAGRLIAVGRGTFESVASALGFGGVVAGGSVVQHVALRARLAIDTQLAPTPAFRSILRARRKFTTTIEVYP